MISCEKPAGLITNQLNSPNLIRTYWLALPSTFATTAPVVCAFGSMTLLPAIYTLPCASAAMALGGKPSFRYVEMAKLAGQPVWTNAATERNERNRCKVNPPDGTHYS